MPPIGKNNTRKLNLNSDNIQFKLVLHQEGNHKLEQLSSVIFSVSHVNTFIDFKFGKVLVHDHSNNDNG